MRKLTNRQMEVLSERVTDLLQEAHMIANKEVKESDEYKNFEKIHSDEIVLQLMEFKREFNVVEDLIMRYKKFCDENNLICNNYTDDKVGYTLDRYLEQKKREKYSAVNFDRDKTLRRVQADILLSDIDNPEELVKSLVEKLK